MKFREALTDERYSSDVLQHLWPGWRWDHLWAKGDVAALVFDERVESVGKSVHSVH